MRFKAFEIVVPRQSAELIVDTLMCNGVGCEVIESQEMKDPLNSGPRRIMVIVPEEMVMELEDDSCGQCEQCGGECDEHVKKPN